MISHSTQSQPTPRKACDHKHAVTDKLRAWQKTSGVRDTVSRTLAKRDGPSAAQSHQGDQTACVGTSKKVRGALRLLSVTAQRFVHIYRRHGMDNPRLIMQPTSMQIYGRGQRASRGENHTGKVAKDSL